MFINSHGHESQYFKISVMVKKESRVNELPGNLNYVILFSKLVYKYVLKYFSLICIGIFLLISTYST